MKKKKFDTSDADSLRKKAEELLKKKSFSGATILNPESDVLKLIHELQVHQIELEMQNSELIESKELAETTAKEYAELYNSAPMGYVTLSSKGEVKKLNFAMAMMLGKKQLQLTDSMFGFFVTDETKLAFNLFLDNVFRTKTKESCEVMLSPKGKDTIHVYLSGVADESGKECLLTVVDISELKKTEQELIISRRENFLLANLATANKELVFQNEEKAKRADELVIANKELKYQNEEKAKRADELVIANKELKYQNEEKAKRAAELVIANKELKYQNEEKAKRAAELVIANKELKYQNEEKAKRAAELVNANKKLEIQKELISTVEQLRKAEHDLKERNKELQAMYGLSKIAAYNDLNNEGLYRALLNIIKGSWQYPEITCCRIVVDGAEYCTENFAETDWKQSEPIKSDGKVIGRIDVLYLKKKKEAGEGPFLNEERNLLIAIAERLGYIINRKAAGEEIKRQSALINSLIDSIPDLIFFKDKEGVFLGCNSAFTALIGKPKEELIGKTDYDIVNKETADFFRHHDKLMLTENQTHRNEELVTYPDGRKVLLDTMKTPYLDANGDLIGILGIGRDITEKKKSEAEIKLKNEELLEINSEKDKFFSIVAHDLRGPFSGFLGLTNIFASEFSEMNQDEIQKLALLMKDSAVNLYRLLENLLEWSQMKRGLTVVNPEQFSINKILSGSINLIKELAAKKEITISSDVQEELQVFADINMFEAAVRNLLSNALKFTNKGGSVTLSANSTTDNKVEVSVKDTGIGMNKEIMEGLFRLDVSTKRKGTDGEPTTGLGLHICKEFIEKNGGILTIESEEGKGSTFKFTIPLFDEKAGENKVLQSVKVNRGGINNLTVLIAEDDNISAKLLASLVRKFSKETLIARTGLEAVEICRNNPDIDLVLMDIKMPGIDGFEATRQIREFNKDVVIIAQTAFVLSDHAEKAKEAGFNDTITKIFDIEFLEEIIGKHIG
ncbi:MAG: PAS domain S-box protein [Ignavibacteriae bacterium]|nr:PAS domain S-box protein [Ignavibacteriota bacterium]